jgi:signal transduction histidine kinase
MRSPRLRRSTVTLGGVLLTVALLGSLALVTMTTVLKHEAEAVGIADARMRASLRTKVALLWYARASDVAVSQASPGAIEERARAETDLRSTLAQAVRLATPERTPQVDALERKTGIYIDLRRRLEDERLPLGVVLERSTPALESVFADLRQLVADDDAWVQTTEASARHWGHVAGMTGVVASALLIVGFVASVLGMAVLVERPVVGLIRAVTRFAGGEETSRSLPRGARELRQMSTTFNELADRLVRQNHDRLTFLSGVAHDLRTPLSAVRMATSFLQGGSQPASPETLARTLELVTRQVDRLDRMVGDLLDATRIEAGRLELRLETSDLRVLVDRAVELFRPSAGAHEIAVVAPAEPVLVQCDATRIEQVLNNLVSNAIKYSPAGGRVTVATSSQGTDAVVAVSDEGIGIAPEDRGRIFEPFRRTRTARELVPGVGLGLSVARKIVQAHGGRIDVDSEPGSGSTFWVRLHSSTGPTPTPA